ncbi:MAG: hypothetical protein SGPRY_000879 [Prymnesium sp.]
MFGPSRSCGWAALLPSALLGLLSAHASLSASEPPSSELSRTSAATRALVAFKAQLAALPPIPRVAHVVWERRIEVESSSERLVREGVKRLVDLNPEWTLHFADKLEVDEYFHKHLTTVQYWQMRTAQQVERTDLWRHLVMCREGGLYVDLDRLVNRPLSEVLPNGSRMLLASFQSLEDFSQDLLCSAPRNPLHCAVVEKHLQLRARCQNPLAWVHGQCSMFSFDSPLTMAVYTKLLFGTSLHRGPEKGSRRIMRQLLKSLHPYAVVWDENPPLRTALHTPNSAHNNPQGTSAFISRRSQKMQQTGAGITTSAEFERAKMEFYRREQVGFVLALISDI